MSVNKLPAASINVDIAYIEKCSQLKRLLLIETAWFKGSVIVNCHKWYTVSGSVGCPWGKSLSSRTDSQVLGLQILVLGPQSPWKLSRTSHSANSLLCVITWSINSVTTTVHEVTVKNDLLTDIRSVLLSSRKVLVLEDAWGPIYKSCPRTLSP